jgi:hypothetical protein
MHQVQIEFLLVMRLFVPAFRGAIIRAMGDKAHPLMHNHDGEGLRFAYPLVQYKVLDGHPAIVAFGDVGEYLARHFEQHKELTLELRGRERIFKLSESSCCDYSPIYNDNPKYYSMARYLPLTETNVLEYKSLMALTDKICFLEKIITGNILSFFKGIGYTATEQIEAVITSIDKQEMIVYKGVHFMAFDLHFVSNLVLPDYIGLGKSSSVGMGVVCQEPLPEQFKHYKK